MDSKTEKFLQKIKDKGYWNDDLDYSKGVYLCSIQRFEVWCKIHKVELTKKTAQHQHIITPPLLKKHMVFLII